QVSSDAAGVLDFVQVGTWLSGGVKYREPLAGESIRLASELQPFLPGKRARSRALGRQIMKRHVVRFSFLALAIVFCVAIKAPAQVAGRQVLCPGDPIPVGWIKVDERPDASSCDNADVVWVVETFTNKAPGSAMVICADQPTPGG